MPTPATPLGTAGLAAILHDPVSALLAFDYDGVLAPIVDDPLRSPPHPRAIPALARLAPLVGSLVIITGRPVEVVVSYCEFATFPALSQLVVLGHYGRERWDGGTGQVTAPPPSQGVGAARVELPLLLGSLASSAWLEDKGGSLAVHTRRSPDPHGTLAMLREPVAKLAARHGLIVEPGRLVLELRPPGVDKGAALRSHVAERAAKAVAYTGDDLGDISAFDAVESLRGEGLAGLKVCSGSAEVVELARRADLVVDGPAGVVDLVDAIADALALADGTG
jgi:trehalose 6-phosphate phosphatase